MVRDQLLRARDRSRLGGRPGRSARAENTRRARRVARASNADARDHRLPLEAAAWSARARGCTTVRDLRRSLVGDRLCRVARIGGGKAHRRTRGSPTRWRSPPYSSPSRRISTWPQTTRRRYGPRTLGPGAGTIVWAPVAALLASGSRARRGPCTSAVGLVSSWRRLRNVAHHLGRVHPACIAPADPTRQHRCRTPHSSPTRRDAAALMRTLFWNPGIERVLVVGGGEAPDGFPSSRRHPLPPSGRSSQADGSIAHGPFGRRRLDVWPGRQAFTNPRATRIADLRIHSRRRSSSVGTGRRVPRARGPIRRGRRRSGSSLDVGPQQQPRHEDDRRSAAGKDSSSRSPSARAWRTSTSTVPSHSVRSCDCG